jgi:hypothetical protein
LAAALGAEVGQPALRAVEARHKRPAFHLGGPFFTKKFFDEKVSPKGPHFHFKGERAFSFSLQHCSCKLKFNIFLADLRKAIFTHSDAQIFNRIVLVPRL